MARKKPQIQINAEQAKHYWTRTANAVQVNVEEENTILADISRSMDGEIKKGVTKSKKAAIVFVPEAVDHVETMKTFLYSWFLHEYVFRARYHSPMFLREPLLLDLYPHRLAWGYSWELLTEYPAIPGLNHLYIDIPPVDDDMYHSTCQEIREELVCEYPEEMPSMEQILNRIFARFPKDDPRFDRERLLLMEDFTCKYTQLRRKNSDKGSNSY